MANAVKGEASIEVEGQTYVLAFNINAMCEVEYLLDLSTDRILQKLVASPPLHIVRALLWAGLRAHHDGIDLHGAGDLIEKIGGPGLVLEGIGKALVSAFPDAEDGADNSPPRTGAAVGTGRRSLRRGSQSAKTLKPSGAQPHG